MEYHVLKCTPEEMENLMKSGYRVYLMDTGH